MAATSSPNPFQDLHLDRAALGLYAGGASAQTPTFVWGVVPGAARYKLEVSLTPTFSNLYDSTMSDVTRYTPVKKYADQGVNIVHVQHRSHAIDLVSVTGDGL